MSGAHQSPESRARQSERLKRLWADPEYRAKNVARLRAQQRDAITVAVEKRKRERVTPERRTPEYRYYEKLRRALGVTAAREALGMGR